MISKSSAAPGNSPYKLWQDVHDEIAHVLVEHRKDAKSLKGHQKTEHWKHFDPGMND